MNKLLRNVLGDTNNTNHRAAFDGNAMVFNQSRWVQLTAGANPLPTIAGTTLFTFIASFKPNAGGIDVGSNLSMCNFSTPTIYHNFTFTNTIQVYQQFTSPGNYAVTTAVAWAGIENKRQHGVTTYNGVQNLASSVDFWINGFKINAKSLLVATQTPFSGIVSPLNIGRFNSGTGRWQGWVRSLELIVGRVLTSEQIRESYNLGTAHAAGLITSSDISIDFNRSNGQLPICRAGSRQLTVTAYNNTTPDTAGTTYTNFNAL